MFGGTPVYDGTGRGRRALAWMPGNPGVVAALSLAQDELRAKSRDLVRRNAWAAAGIEAFVANAIGTGINAPVGYVDVVVPKLAEFSGVPVVKATDLIAATGDTGAFADISGILKRIAVKLSKISNDLRLLSSGPQAGVGDIKLPARQAGSSIMPGKVNPVIPEVMNQVCFEVIGNDAAITMAVEAGQLQLNAFEPLMAWALHKSLSHLSNACKTLQVNCVEGIVANQDLLDSRIAESVTLVTALNPLIGYE